jgi:hypothetical protein
MLANTMAIINVIKVLDKMRVFSFVSCNLLVVSIVFRFLPVMISYPGGG